jgi:two-component system response regulator FixJ
LALLGHGDLAVAVQAMKTGACDFLAKTVQVHRHNTMEKLGVHSAAEVAHLLMEAKARHPGSH